VAGGAAVHGGVWQGSNKKTESQQSMLDAPHGKLGILPQFKDASMKRA
jgi:hypothetical protein